MVEQRTGLDLVTLGRSSVDLYGQQIGGRLEDMSSFAKYVGGSPTNTAVGATRLGLKTGLITRVGADHMGRFLREELAAEGVDTQGIIDDAQRLTALVILGIVDHETFPLLFYRENCADMALTPDDLDAEWLKTSRALLINGTHLSQDGVRATSLAAAAIVKAAGGRIVFDIDYRPVLWGLTARDQGENRYVPAPEVTQSLLQVAPLCDLIIGTEEEIRILGGSDDTLTALKAIRAVSAALLVCKLGSDGCVLFSGAIPDAPVSDVKSAGLHVPGFAIEVFNVLGAGDAFCAGFLKAWLSGWDLRTCGRWANACGAIVVMRHGCAPAMPTEEELRQYLAAEVHPLSADARSRLDHLHWATTRRVNYDELVVLAMDHRNQFEDIAAEVGAEAERISAFKRLAIKAVHSVANDDPRFGVLLDGRYGSEALAEAASHNYWIGRPIEEPKSRPLAFESSADVGMDVLQWPRNHVVKCLMVYHPEDEAEVRAVQERQIMVLFDACRKSGHELLLEVILPPELEADATTLSRAMTRLYDIGIMPDWWKLEPVRDPQVWANVQAVIDARDPHSRGVLLLGLQAPPAELLQAFAVAAGFPCVKGFAVGRTIFHDVAIEWFSDRIGDEEAIAALARNFSVFVEAWRAARRKVERAA